MFGGKRVPKDSAVPEAVGTLDELNSVLGWARSAGLADEVDAAIDRVQRELFLVGGALEGWRPDQKDTTLGDEHVAWLESEIDRAEAQLPVFKQFVLPGGTWGGAALHVARTVCRRAERRIVTLARSARAPNVLCVF